MSVKLLSWVLEEVPKKHPKLDPTARLILLILADHFNDHEGAAWPSHGRVATMAGVSEDTVRRHLKAMEEIGLVSSKPREGRSNLYVIPPASTHPTPRTDAPPPPAPMHPLSPIYTTLNEPLKNAKPAGECEHGEKRGKAYCALCRHKGRQVKSGL